MKQAEQHPYKSYVRGVEVDFSRENIRRVLRIKEQTPEAETDYATHQRMDQRLDELRRAELTPLTRGWHEFIIHSIIPTGNRSKITIARAILIHSIIKGEDVRAEELIEDNIADAQVPLHEFRRTELIPQDKPITARLMETTRLGRDVQVQQQQNEEEEDQAMPQFEGGNEEGHDQGQHQHFEQQFQQPEAGFQQNSWEQQQ
ncbi:hypothetical protein PIB30_083699 [Stylosanthes scabra]|uniref:Putative plant transposon protein domain-containing protein n=1 Tax=Stylosanthes scabra TaxID=79078 RepID=A0ABU6ZQZ0_9FABA|nr:hypothetical protein [Stylosanthes scabra]